MCGKGPKSKLAMCFIHTVDTEPEGNFIQPFQCTYISAVTYYKGTGVEFSTHGVKPAQKVSDF